METNIDKAESVGVLPDYLRFAQDFFSDSKMFSKMSEWRRVIMESERIIFLGNGGSNSIASHLMQDFGKVLNKQTLSFSDPSLITCFANDYGYENAMEEWLKRQKLNSKDLVIAISSSGKSYNLIRAIIQAQMDKAKTAVLTAFDKNNDLRFAQSGEKSDENDLDIHLKTYSYGIAECFHQIILHMILDELVVKTQIIHL